MSAGALRDKIRQLYNAGFDRAYNIETLETPETGVRHHSLLGDDIRYVPIDYIGLCFLLAGVRLSPEDAFIDIGCGLGRAVCVMARRPIRHAIGIEYNARLAQAARRNVANLRGRRAPAEIAELDATAADYDAGTIFWLYNPFGEATMSRVIERLRASFAGAPRRMRIIYAHPVHAQLFDAQNWLRRVAHRRFPMAGENGSAIYWEAG